jgi:hypothetical protein
MLCGGDSASATRGLPSALSSQGAISGFLQFSAREALRVPLYAHPVVSSEALGHMAVTGGTGDSYVYVNLPQIQTTTLRGCPCGKTVVSHGPGGGVVSVCPAVPHGELSLDHS